MALGAQAEGLPLTPRAAETRERILDAAETVFGQRGFDAATTREIAALSGTNVATPYTYFAGKEALYAAVIERAIAPLIELMDQFARESDKPGAAAAAIHAVLERLSSHEATTRLIYREAVANGPLAERLTKTLFEPLIDRVCAELRAVGNVEPGMEPFVASLYVHLSFSHVALGPLLSKVFDLDMLSPDSLARQVRLIGAAGGLGVKRFSQEE
ncbi:MAG: TetR family transcriptional regulator [Proteobacteria bacterium]|nr:TetR family transcriptional regulator [Pseudomonadota bacterium]